MLAPIHKDHNFKIEISLVLEMLQTENSKQTMHGTES